MNTSSQTKPVLTAKNLSFSYGKNLVVDKLDIEVFDSEIFCILGPSGCGKSTLLRILAGLENPSSGSVQFAKSGANTKSGGIGYVFQELSLIHISEPTRPY